MKIASSTISATVVHSAMRAQTRHPSLRTWVGADPRQHAAATPDNSLVRASEATRRSPVMGRPKPPPVHGDGDAKSTSQSSRDRDVDAITPRLSMLRDLIERMTGIRLQAVHWREATAADAPPPSPQSTAPTQSAAGQPNWGAELEHQTVLEETESTQFAAQGIVRTADGQEIRFSVQLSMQRSYREASSTTVRMGNAVKPADPLVINFNGTAAQLHGSRFDFRRHYRILAHARQRQRFPGAGPQWQWTHRQWQRAVWPDAGQWLQRTGRARSGRQWLD